MTTKTCNHRDHEGERDLPLSAFHKDKHSPDGLKSMCRVCASRKAQAWRAERAKDPEWRAKFNEGNTRYRNAAGKVGQLYSAAKQRAQKKGIPFTITKEDIIIPDVCPILGIPIIAGKGRKSDGLVGATDNSPSIDRIDNSKGYVPGNIVVISWRANYLKNTATLEELVMLGKFAERYING
jgi:hypothetical protein